MKPATFDHTISILAKAYLDGTLLKGNCAACAVGNLMAAALGYHVTVVPLAQKPASPERIRADAYWNEQDVLPMWGGLFATDSAGSQRITQYLGEALAARYGEAGVQAGRHQLAATGYRIDELARIEYAFETAAPGYTEEAEFAGLMAVTTVLAEIHGVDLAAVTIAKSLFSKVAA